MDARPTPEAIAAHYTSAVAPIVGRVEAARHAACNKFVLYAALAIIGNCLIIALSLSQNWYTGPENDWVGFNLAIVLISAGVVWNPLAAFRKRTKTQLLDALVPMFPGFNIYQLRMVPAHIINRSGIFPSHEVLHGSNLIEGTYRGITIQSSDVDLKVTVRTKNGRSERTVFEGAVYLFSFPKPFAGDVRITTDRGWLINKVSGALQRFDRVSLEDPQFEDIFEVYGYNQVEARYLLTTAFMDRLLNLARANGHKLEAAFFDKQLLVKIERDGERFVVTNPLRRIDWHAEAMRFVDEFDDALGIVDALKLNQNIGL